MTTTVRKRLHIYHRVHSDKQNWGWHITLGNGEIVANGELYENEANMAHMLANLFDLTPEQSAELHEKHLVTWAVAK